MSILQKLSHWLGKKGPIYERDRPFGLSAEKIAALKEFRDSDAFPVYLEALDATVKLVGETLLVSRDDAVLHETRGTLLGLRRAASLVDEILSKETQRASRVDSGADTGRADARAAALYGTPAYGRD